MDTNGEPHKAPWFKYKNSTKSLKRDLSDTPLSEYLQAFKPLSECLEDSNNNNNNNNNAAHRLPLPDLELALDQYRHNPDKLSVLSQIYHDLLYTTTRFTVKPKFCSNANDDDTSVCSFQKRGLCTWQTPVITFNGLFKLECYHHYCLTHCKFVERKVLLHLCLQQLGFSVFKSGHMMTSCGVNLFLRNVFLLQTNMSLVVNVANVLLFGILHDRINVWKSNADPQKIALLEQIFTQYTDDESAEALDSITIKRAQMLKFCEEVCADINQLATKLFDDCLTTDCRIIEGTVICQINFDATFDAGENITNCGKNLRSVVANFCTNMGKVSNPPILARSENTKLFVDILSTMCNKVFKHYEKTSRSFLFLLVLDDTKSYVNLPTHLSTRLKNEKAVDFNVVHFQILLGEDRMHRVGRWFKQMPKSLHQYGLFLRCISAHHARAEKGSIKLSAEPKMNVDPYFVQFGDDWQPVLNDARDDLCRLIMTLTKIEDNKFCYEEEEYCCQLKCISLFVHALEYLGELASNFFARYILFKGHVPEQTLNTTTEIMITSRNEHWEVYCCALPSFIFTKLTELCGYQMSLSCWQTETQCFWGFMNIYHIAKHVWSDHDSVCMASQPGFQRRLSLDTEPMAIAHLMNNRYNTSSKSGTAVTTERVHGYNNSHNIKRYRGNILHTLGVLNIHAFKKTKIAIYDEKHGKHNNNCSQWHKVTVQSQRKLLIELLKHRKILNVSSVLPKTNRSNQVQSDIKSEHNSKADRKRRYQKFKKNSNNVNQNNNNNNYHRPPTKLLNEELSNLCVIFYLNNDHFFVYTYILRRVRDMLKMEIATNNRQPPNENHPQLQMSNYSCQQALSSLSEVTEQKKKPKEPPMKVRKLNNSKKQPSLGSKPL